jgi:hypothetical protein
MDKVRKPSNSVWTISVCKSDPMALVFISSARCFSSYNELYARPLIVFGVFPLMDNYLFTYVFVQINPLFLDIGHTRVAAQYMKIFQHLIEMAKINYTNCVTTAILRSRIESNIYHTWNEAQYCWTSQRLWLAVCIAASSVSSIYDNC